MLTIINDLDIVKKKKKLNYERSGKKFLQYDDPRSQGVCKWQNWTQCTDNLKTCFFEGDEL